MSLLKRISCPTCNKQNFKRMFSLPYNSEKIVNFLKTYYKNSLNIIELNRYEYTLLECLNCSLIFQEQIPDEEFSIKLYESIIDQDESLLKKQDFEKNFNKKLSFEMNLIKNIFNKNSKDIFILEFGAGWGFWSKYAQDNNFNVSAFEVSKKRIEFMQKNKIQIESNIDNSKYKYDLIYSEETFEHISDPRDTIIRLSGLLKNGGYFLLRFPSTFLFKLKLNKKYIPTSDCAHPLEHINLFNKKSFNFMLEDTDLEIISFKSKFSFSFGSFLRDLKNLIYFDSVLIKKK